MKKVRFICLDDEASTVRRILNQVSNQVTGLEIETLPPMPFEKQIDHVSALATSGKIQGIILDLRLDRHAAGKGEEAVRYTAPGLAAQLRNIQTTNHSQPSFPILLWSVQALLERDFYPDLTNRDLFDSIYTKKYVTANELRFANELMEFAKAYTTTHKALQTSCLISNLLVAPKGMEISERLEGEFGNAVGNRPTYVFVKFLFEEIINTPGPLLSKEHLLALLGISADSPTIDSLLDSLPTRARYKGPFATAWPRWWRAEIAAWWAKSNPAASVIERVPGPARAARVQEMLGIAPLKPASPANGESSYFSTICEVTKRALDPIDGFVVRSSNRHPWQDRKYVSREVALDPAKHDFRGQLEPAEVIRLKTLRGR